MMIWRQFQDYEPAFLVFFEYAADEDDADVEKGRIQITADKAKDIRKRFIKMQKGQAQ